MRSRAARPSIRVGCLSPGAIQGLDGWSPLALRQRGVSDRTRRIGQLIRSPSLAGIMLRVSSELRSCFATQAALEGRAWRRDGGSMRFGWRRRSRLHRCKGPVDSGAHLVVRSLPKVAVCVQCFSGALVRRQFLDDLHGRAVMVQHARVEVPQHVKVVALATVSRAHVCADMVCADMVCEDMVCVAGSAASHAAARS